MPPRPCSQEGEEHKRSINFPCLLFFFSPGNSWNNHCVFHLHQDKRKERHKNRGQTQLRHPPEEHPAPIPYGSIMQDTAAMEVEKHHSNTTGIWGLQRAIHRRSTADFQLFGVLKRKLFRIGTAILT